MRKNTRKGQPVRNYVVGMSGASGAIYGVRLVEALLAGRDRQVHLIATAAGLRVLRDEIGIVMRGERAPADQALLRGYFDLPEEAARRLHVHPTNDIGAAPASGTFLAEAMIVVPCSMNTLACIAHGLQPNLLTRSAAVALKEGWPLILVPRETPVGLIELRNMTAAAEAGATILPANPGFYHQPQTIEDLVRFVIQKVMDRLGLEVKSPIRWTGKTPSVGLNRMSNKDES